jgi:hypothetical protein
MEKPYLYPPPRVLVAPGKTVPITSLSEEEQAQYEAQILFVSEVAKIEFYEDDEWMVGS